MSGTSKQDDTDFRFALHRACRDNDMRAAWKLLSLRSVPHDVCTKRGQLQKKSHNLRRWHARTFELSVAPSVGARLARFHGSALKGVTQLPLSVGCARLVKDQPGRFEVVGTNETIQVQEIGQGDAHEWIAAIDEACIKAMADNGAGPDMIDEDGLLPLHVAMQHLHWDCLDAVVEAYPLGAAAPFPNGWLPLANAIQLHVPLDTMCRLLRACPEATQQSDQQGNLPLHMACLTKLWDAVPVLVESNPQSAAERNANGKLPVQLAWDCQAWPSVVVLATAAPEAFSESLNATQLPLDQCPDDVAAELVAEAPVPPLTWQQGNIELFLKSVGVAAWMEELKPLVSTVPKLLQLTPDALSATHLPAYYRAKVMEALGALKARNNLDSFMPEQSEAEPGRPPSVADSPDYSVEFQEQLDKHTAGRWQVHKVLDKKANNAFSVLATDSKHGHVVVRAFARPNDEPITQAQRLALEQQVAALSATSNAHMVRLHSGHFAPDNSLFWVVQEVPHGESLRSLQQRNATLTEAEAIEMGLACLECLQLLHAKDVLHCSVDPRHVIKTGSAGAFKLLPYTLEKFFHDTGIVDAGSLEGDDGAAPDPRLLYCSPSTLSAKPRTVQDELWEVGATLFAGVTGRAPFESVSDVLSAREATDVRSVGGQDISVPFAETVARALSKGALARFSDTTAMRLVLDEALALGGQHHNHLYLSCTSPAHIAFALKLKSELAGKKVGPQREGIRVYVAHEGVIPRPPEHSLRALQRSLVFVPLLSGAIVQDLAHLDENEGADRLAQIVELDAALRLHANDSDCVLGILPLLMPSDVPIADAVDGLPSGSSAPIAGLEAALEQRGHLSLPGTAHDARTIAQEILKFQSIQTEEMERAGETVSEHVGAVVDSIAWMRRAKHDPLKRRDSGRHAPATEPTQRALVEGVVEVEVPPGALGVKFSLHPPLRVLEVCTLPDGSPSPVAGKVAKGSILLGIDGQDATHCSLRDFKATMQAECRSHKLTFKLPSVPGTAPMEPPAPKGRTKAKSLFEPQSMARVSESVKSFGMNARSRLSFASLSQLAQPQAGSPLSHVESAHSAHNAPNAPIADGSVLADAAAAVAAVECANEQQEQPAQEQKQPQEQKQSQEQEQPQGQRQHDDTSHEAEQPHGSGQGEARAQGRFGIGVGSGRFDYSMSLAHLTRLGKGVGMLASGVVSAVQPSAASPMANLVIVSGGSAMSAQQRKSELLVLREQTNELLRHFTTLQPAFRSLWPDKTPRGNPQSQGEGGEQEGENGGIGSHEKGRAEEGGEGEEEGEVASPRPLDDPEVRRSLQFVTNNGLGVVTRLLREWESAEGVVAARECDVRERDDVNASLRRELAQKEEELKKAHARLLEREEEVRRLGEEGRQRADSAQSNATDV